MFGKRPEMELAVFFRLISVYKYSISDCQCFAALHIQGRKSQKWNMRKKITETALEIVSLVLRNHAKFTGKHLCESCFYNNVPGLYSATVKKETQAQVT